MTHRERVLAAVRHETPDRTPICWLALENPTPLLERLGLDPASGNDGLGDYFGADVRMLGAVHTDDMFGNAGHGKPYGLELERKPFYNAGTVKEIESYPWPSIDTLDFSALQLAGSAKPAKLPLSWTVTFHVPVPSGTAVRVLV